MRLCSQSARANCSKSPGFRIICCWVSYTSFGVDQSTTGCRRSCEADRCTNNLAAVSALRSSQDCPDDDATDGASTGKRYSRFGSCESTDYAETYCANLGVARPIYE